MNARFQAGDAVRIEPRAEPRHHRVPSFVKGHVGTVERVCAANPLPEQVAYADPDGATSTVYRVRLSQADLWPDYAGAPADTLEIEIFEHWLESA